MNEDLQAGLGCSAVLLAFAVFLFLVKIAPNIGAWIDRH